LAQLILVRHGQATPFEEITDRLSPLGETQSRKLAELWIHDGTTFDEVYTGSLNRQRRTEELVREAFVAIGLAWPEAQVIPELNEYDADSVVKHLAPQLARRDPQFRMLVEAIECGGGPDQNRRFQKMFEALMNRWITGELASNEVESWHTFRGRVQQGLRRITGGAGPRPAQGRRVVAFTSGGPIGVAVQIALNAPDRAGLEVNWRVRNCSLTEFVFSGGRLSLDSFNAIPHLDDPALRTFR
jgi:broad specificity phosphatase PhoE